MEVHLPALAAAAAAVAALTFWRPLAPLGALFAALPFLTHHPSTAPAVWLMALVAAFEAAWLVRSRRSLAALARGVAREPMLALGVAFAVTAVASLIALPLAGLWAEYAAALRLTDRGGWPSFVEIAVRHVEFRREFSVVSALLLAQAALLMLIVHHETAGAPARGRALALAIVGSVTVSAVLGAAELAGLVSLDAVRGTAGVFVRPGTLQATAGNPGWFTQYVAYALPYGLVLVAGRPLRSARGAALLVWTTGLLIALLFGYQRGGWITGVIAGAYVAATARLVAARPAATRAAARGWIGPLAAAVAVLAVLGGVAARWQPAAYTGVDPGERIRSIVRGDRWPYWQAAGLIWTRHPILGGGHESFAYRYREYFETPGAVYATSPVRVPDAASAHSLYMQTLAGTGAGGLALLLALFGAAAVTSRAVRRAPALPADARALALAAAGSLLAVAVYGLVQEVFYVHALRLLTFAGVGLLTAAGTGLVAWPAAGSRAIAGVAVALVAAHAGYERLWASPERLLGAGTVGLYEPESNAGHESIRWTTETAAIPAPAGAGQVTLDVRSVAPFPQRLRVAACTPATEVAIADHEWHSVTVALRGCGPGDHVRLTVHPGWRPAGDGRLLGVMTRAVGFR